MDLPSSDDRAAILPSNNQDELCSFEDAATYSPVLFDPFARCTIEQIVLDSFEALGEQLGTSNNDDDNNGEESAIDGNQNDTGGDSNGMARIAIKELNDRIAQKFEQLTLDSALELLFRDNCIIQGAKMLKIDPDSRLRSVDPTTLEFHLPVDGFDEWKLQHEQSISTNFVTVRGEYVRGDEQFSEIRKKSMKQGCTFKIVALRQKSTGVDGISHFVYLVSYQYQHNHTLGSLTDLGTRQKSAAIKATIRHLILQGSTIQRVMQQLTMDYDKFTQILRGDGRKLSRDGFITYDDVYYEWHSITTKRMRKDDNAIISSIKWMETFEASGDFTYYNKDDQSLGLYFGFASKWQLEQLHKHGRVLCFDGTHNPFGLETHILVGWLKALQNKMRRLFSTAQCDYNFKPNAVITDQGNTEILAVKSAFPGVPIFYCAWHVLKVWEREAKSTLRNLDELSVALRNDKRAEVKADLRRILYTRNTDAALDLITAFREKWHAQQPLLTYLDKNYFGTSTPDENIRRRWMVCYRQEVTYCSIDTNNFIESWHNTLKSHFFKDYQQRRPDTVIYILAMMAVLHFQQKCIRSAVGVGRMTPAQKQELKQTEIAQQHLETRIDFSKTPCGHILHCSCPSFHLDPTCCKHIALVQVEIPQMSFLRIDQWEYESNFNPAMLEPDTTIVNDSNASMIRSDAIGYLIARLASLETLRDRTQAIPHDEKIHEHLQQVLSLYESAFPRSKDLQTNVKRQRQHF
ncbi:hypothetical protein BG004_002648 [Podila humilis]|nr:hypothetical protein BG004_002648 [Podila humilis]